MGLNRIIIFFLLAFCVSHCKKKSDILVNQSSLAQIPSQESQIVVIKDFATNPKNELFLVNQTSVTKTEINAPESFAPVSITGFDYALSRLMSESQVFLGSIKNSVVYETETGKRLLEGQWFYFLEKNKPYFYVSSSLNNLLGFAKLSQRDWMIVSSGRLSFSANGTLQQLDNLSPLGLVKFSNTAFLTFSKSTNFVDEFAQQNLKLTAAPKIDLDISSQQTNNVAYRDFNPSYPDPDVNAPYTFIYKGYTDDAPENSAVPHGYSAGPEGIAGNNLESLTEVDLDSTRNLLSASGTPVKYGDGELRAPNGLLTRDNFHPKSVKKVVDVPSQTNNYLIQDFESLIAKTKQLETTTEPITGTYLFGKSVPGQGESFKGYELSLAVSMRKESLNARVESTDTSPPIVILSRDDIKGKGVASFDKLSKDYPDLKIIEQATGGASGYVFFGQFHGSDVVGKYMSPSEVRASEYLSQQGIGIKVLSSRNYTILMEKALADGEAIFDKPFDPKTFSQIGKESSDLLAKLHELGLAHNDFKLDNMLLTTQGYKLSDFGVTGPLGERTNYNFSDPRFLDPLRKQRDISSASGDVYAQGMSLANYYLRQFNPELKPPSLTQLRTRVDTKGKTKDEVDKLIEEKLDNFMTDAEFFQHSIRTKLYERIQQNNDPIAKQLYAQIYPDIGKRPSSQQVKEFFQGL